MAMARHSDLGDTCDCCGRPCDDYEDITHTQLAMMLDKAKLRKKHVQEAHADWLATTEGIEWLDWQNKQIGNMKNFLLDLQH